MPEHGDQRGSRGDEWSAADERPLSELTREASELASRLVRDELALARAELVAKARRTAAGGGMLAAAALLGMFTLAALVGAAIAALSLELATWAAALVVAGACALVLAALARAGLRAIARAAPPIPEQAAQSVKEDVRWARTRAQQARR